jgi:hypothetical protein
LRKLWKFVHYSSGAILTILLSVLKLHRGTRPYISTPTTYLWLVGESIDQIYKGWRESA